LTKAIITKPLSISNLNHLYSSRGINAESWIHDRRIPKRSSLTNPVVQIFSRIYWTVQEIHLTHFADCKTPAHWAASVTKTLPH
jgi:hypothetical protein